MMALSLADELGGELDPHQDDMPVGNHGLGLSLADELDLDLELDQGISHSHSNHHLSPSPPTPNAKLGSGLGPHSRNMHTPRRARTSATSTYYTATASPGRLSDLDSAGDVDQSLYQLDDDMAQNGDDGDDDDEEEDEGDDLRRGEGEVPDLDIDREGSRDSLLSINEAGLPTPKMEEDMLAIIQDQVDDIARFVNSLKLVEPDKSKTIPAKTGIESLNHSLNRSTRSNSTHGSERTEDVLEKYLEAVDKSGKTSEIHTKELTTVRRDFASAPPTPELITGLLGVLGPVDPDVENSSHGEDELLDTTSEESQTTLNPDDSFTTAPDLDLDPTSATSIVTETFQEIIQENRSLTSELCLLGESVHLNQSVQTSTTRQIKGLKSTLMTWKEREEMEERAKVAIEQWERSQVQRGLRGDKGTREVLDEVMQGFHRTLEECERRMGEVRAKYAVTAA